ncbi:MAG TPA: hypothetical protein ENN13_01680 [Candidatus Altiarchaeales archaeon]|nr:hypothetical protein [Candidatus Altiarchaeales archaeon]
MDVKLVVSAVLVFGVLAFILGQSMASEREAFDFTSCGGCVPAAYYLVPQRCIDCALEVGTNCVDCNTYYNIDMLRTMDVEFDTPLFWYPSSLVDKASVFVVGGKNVDLAVVNNKFNLAAALCRIADDARACGAFDAEITRASRCVEKYGISPDTIVLHYSTSETCSHCDRTMMTVVELEELGGYSTFWIDHENQSQMRILNECLSAFTTKDYVPEVICPRKGTSIVGRMPYVKDLRNFAESCRE